MARVLHVKGNPSSHPSQRLLFQTRYGKYKPTLMEQVRDRIRSRHYSPAYRACVWVGSSALLVHEATSLGVVGCRCGTVSFVFGGGGNVVASTQRVGRNKRSVCAECDLSQYCDHARLSTRLAPPVGPTYRYLVSRREIGEKIVILSRLRFGAMRCAYCALYGGITRLLQADVPLKRLKAAI